MHRWSMLFVVSLLAGCATTAPVRQPQGQTPELPLEIHWVRNSAEYRAVLEQTYRLATEVLERRAAGREPGTWAVAIDADETLIGNSLQSKERALDSAGSWESVWDEWVERRAAPALPGAQRFLSRVQELGGRIAVVTNRRDRHCVQTAENLEQVGIPFDVILCRGETRDKQPRWSSVEDGTARADLPALEIVMWVGDNIHDFPDLGQDLRFADPDAFADFGDMFFILPNPLYGSWEDNPGD
ncbi:MAG: HAD hydrolase-like protein [Acidobacteriota bacterium]|nr:HAD hydrolase-like protein [Acidobacteriota bacterium]